MFRIYTDYWGDCKYIYARVYECMGSWYQLPHLGCLTLSILRVSCKFFEKFCLQQAFEMEGKEPTSYCVPCLCPIKFHSGLASTKPSEESLFLCCLHFSENWQFGKVTNCALRLSPRPYQIATAVAQAAGSPGTHNHFLTALASKSAANTAVFIIQDLFWGNSADIKESVTTSRWSSVICFATRDAEMEICLRPLRESVAESGVGLNLPTPSTGLILCAFHALLIEELCIYSPPWLQK